MAEHLFTKNIRVYYEHTDSGGVVYHSNYLNFMEQARSDWLDSLGHGVMTTLENTGVMWVVKEANIIYHQPAKLYDELVVSCDVLQVGKVGLKIAQNVYNNDQLLCSGTIKLATLNSASFTLTKIPSELHQVLLEQQRADAE